jgi:hypothetical protein
MPDKTYVVDKSGNIVGSSEKKGSDAVKEVREKEEKRVEDAKKK